ncbi:MAG: hypothetical protein Cons2KO_26290 [Congregibacter sp.]
MPLGVDAGADTSIKNMLAVLNEKGVFQVTAEEVGIAMGALDHIDRFIAYEDAATQLTFDLEPLTQTWLDSAMLLGVHLEGRYSDGNWTAATRFFQLDAKRYVLLSEADLIEQGGSVRLMEASLNFEVRQMPGTYLNVVGPDGTEQAQFTWFGPTKSFILTTSFSVTPNSTLFHEVFDLAQALASP